MIILTSINGKDFCLNSELIYKIVESPDTIVTLVDGRVLRVSNTMEDIIEKTIEYKRRIHLGPLGGEK